jgi:hypothetical protein
MSLSKGDGEQSTRCRSQVACHMCQRLDRQIEEGCACVVGPSFHFHLCRHDRFVPSGSASADFSEVMLAGRENGFLIGGTGCCSQIGCHVCEGLNRQIEDACVGYFHLCRYSFSQQTVTEK